jgi:hypothetical protein
VEFVVDKVALGEGFFPGILVPLRILLPPIAPHSLITLTSILHRLDRESVVTY